MKLGEIKVEALKLMFTDYVTDYSIDDLTALTNDEVCRNYLVNMPGAINRCYSILESRGVLPAKRAELDISSATSRAGRLRFDLSSLSDYFSVDRIIVEGADGEYNSDYEYILEGDVLVIAAPDDGAYITLLYKPRLERITVGTLDEVEVDVPDNIAALIPYYLKGDLFRDDEPNEASEARNWFEAGINEIVIPKEGRIARVKSVYSYHDNEG